MAITDAYSDAETYRSRVNKSVTTQDADILLGLKAISRSIDRRCRRHFTRDGAPVARTFYAGDDCGISPDGRALYVPDVASKTGFVLKRDDSQDGSFAGDTSWTIDTDFQLKPLNATLGAEPEPWTEIYLPAWGTQSPFREGDFLQITYDEGWPAFPQAIVEATLQIAAILRIESSRATGRIQESIDRAVDESKESQSLIDELVDQYARHTQQVFS